MRLWDPGVSYECQEQHGSHINEDHFYPEIINPETLERLPDGEVGELVFTTSDKGGDAVIALSYEGLDFPDGG